MARKQKGTLAIPLTREATANRQTAYAVGAVQCSCRTGFDRWVQPNLVGGCQDLGNVPLQGDSLPPLHHS